MTSFASFVQLGTLVHRDGTTHTHTLSPVKPFNRETASQCLHGDSKASQIDNELNHHSRAGRDRGQGRRWGVVELHRGHSFNWETGKVLEIGGGGGCCRKM